MVNRNRGSGTRILIDRLLAGRRPRGYAVEARSHNAVAAALQQSRADWGVVIEPGGRRLRALAFTPAGCRAVRFRDTRKLAGTGPRSQPFAVCSRLPRSGGGWPTRGLTSQKGPSHDLRRRCSLRW